MRTAEGLQWCEGKRKEAECLVDWMARHWGLAELRRGTGVIDVGGEPGFLAASLLRRGVAVTIVDPFWRLTGKANACADVAAAAATGGGLGAGTRFEGLREKFDEVFLARRPGLVEGASVLVSLYGDEATDFCLRLAAERGTACAVIPCNECVQFFPQQDRTYEGYVQSLLAAALQCGGRFQRGLLLGAPFARALLFQPPPPPEEEEGGEGDACQQLGSRLGQARRERRQQRLAALPYRRY